MVLLLLLLPPGKRKGKGAMDVHVSRRLETADGEEEEGLVAGGRDRWRTRKGRFAGPFCGSSEVVTSGLSPHFVPVGLRFSECVVST